MPLLRLSASAAEVVAMYAAELPCDVWPELNPLCAWNGSGLVASADNRDGLSEALLQLTNLYSDKADGACPTSAGEPRRFCQHVADGLSTARGKLLRLSL